MTGTTAFTFPLTYKLGGDLQINRMGFGAMRITGDGIWGAPKNIPEAKRVLTRAVEMGVNFIDTADSYGPYVSEELIAETLFPYPDGLVIATKGGLLRTGPNEWPVNAHPNHLRNALEGSLKRLKLSCIDLYQLHRVDPEVPYEQTLEFLQDIQEKGLVKHIGLSEVSIAQIKKAQKYVNIVSVQNMYSFENRKWEAELEYCQNNNIAFIPWYPLGAGKIKSMDLLNRLAAKYEATPYQLALSWLLHHAPNILLIPGTSSVSHLEENMKATTIRLSSEDMHELEKASGAEISG